MPVAAVEPEFPGQGQVAVMAVDRKSEDVCVGTIDGSLVFLDADQQPTNHRCPFDAGVEITALEFSPGGDRLAIGNANGTCKIWSREARRFEDMEPRPMHRVHTLLWRDKGKSVIVAHGETLSVLSRSSNNRWRWAPDLVGPTAPVLALAGDPNRPDVLAGAGRDKTVRLWRLGATSPYLEMLGHYGRIESLAFSPDGKILASGATDSSVVLWDLKVGRQRIRLEQDSVIAGSVLLFTPDQKALISGDASTSLYMWRGPPASGRTTVPR